MNPFDLGADGFLFFYIALSIALSAGAHQLIVRVERAVVPGLEKLCADPYCIAYLRGGTLAVAQLTVVMLLDRALLRIVGDTRVEAVAGWGSTLVDHPVEQAVMRTCEKPTNATELHQWNLVLRATESLTEPLAATGLVPNSRQRRIRYCILAVIVAGLLYILRQRTELATVRGHDNVALLYYVAFGAMFGADRVCRLRCTQAGRRAVEHLQALFVRLKSNALELEPGGRTGDALLLAAVYGVLVLPSSVFPFVRKLYPRTQQSGDGGGGGISDSGGGGCGGCGG